MIPVARSREGAHRQDCGPVAPGTGLEGGVTLETVDV